MKIAINKSYGGFVLSDKGMNRYAELAGIPLVYKDGEFYTHFVDPDNLYVDSDIGRDDVLKKMLSIENSTIFAVY